MKMDKLWNANLDVFTIKNWWWWWTYAISWVKLNDQDEKDSMRIAKNGDSVRLFVAYFNPIQQVLCKILNLLSRGRMRLAVPHAG